MFKWLKRFSKRPKMKITRVIIDFEWEPATTPHPSKWNFLYTGFRANVKRFRTIEAPKGGFHDD